MGKQKMLGDLYPSRQLQDRSLVVMAYYKARNARIEVEREVDLARQLEAIKSATQRARREAGD
jgi:hypothetical protein